MIKIKYMGEKYGRVMSVLPHQRYHKEVAQLHPPEIAQLILDLQTVPQPFLRPSETRNLIRLLYSHAKKEWGRVFDRTMAVTLTMAMKPAGVARFDQVTDEAEFFMLQ